MMVRAIILTILLASSMGWFMAKPSQEGVAKLEAGFFDFFVANATEVFSKGAAQESGNVVLLEFREEDKGEYGGWPPTPLDYIMILRRLAEFEPTVLVIVEPLRWDASQTDLMAPLREALVPFPSVVTGFHLGMDAGEMTREQSDFLAREIPVLPPAESMGHEPPKFSRVGALSDYSLRVATQSGFTAVTGLTLPKAAVPFVVSDGSRLVPSLAAQSVILYHRMPYAEQRLSFGTGARLSLGGEFVIPLNHDGSYNLTGDTQVPTVNALELTVPDLGDEASRMVRTTLGKGKIIVLGNGPDSLLQARTIASLLAIPQVYRAASYADWVFAGGACLLAFVLLRFTRWKALFVGLALMGGGLMVVMLSFQSNLTWWSPLPGLLLVAVSTVFCFFWPATGTPAATGLIDKDTSASPPQ